jgi:TPR repeat protein
MVSRPLRALQVLAGVFLWTSVFLGNKCVGAFDTQTDISAAEKRLFVKTFLRAEKDDPEAQYVLGMMYYSGQKIPQDKALALKWFTKAAQQDFSAAQYFLSLMYGLGDGVAQDDSTAVWWCRKAALQGHVDAQYSLGRMYSTGQGVKKDDVRAVDWFSKAAEQGHADAQCDLGLMYNAGRGVSQDLNRATQWWVKASQQGHAWSGLLLQEAMQSASKPQTSNSAGNAIAKEKQLISSIEEDLVLEELADQKLIGPSAAAVAPERSQDNEPSIAQQTHKGVPEAGDLMVVESIKPGTAEDDSVDRVSDLTVVLPQGLDRESEKLKESSSDRLDQPAEEMDVSDQYDLAIMYYEGKEGLAQDYVKAAENFTAAAEQGHRQAQYKLGVMYSFGQGIPQDPAKAVQWFHEAAQQNLPAAQYSLGVMYATGQGVQSDPATAVHWYTKAAEQGSVAAQFMLGMAYSKGQGVTRDSEMAVHWYAQAAQQGAPAAQYLLAVLYEEGKGVVLQNPDEAMKWYKEAAYNGHPQAQYDLADKYFTGQIVERDNIRAYMWCLIAGVNGKNVTQYEQQLESRMTASQLEQSRRLAREILARIERKKEQAVISTTNLHTPNAKNNSLP